jgi:hypothetical protein
VDGDYFQSGVRVHLQRGGYSDIVATNVNIVSPTLITCQFDLASAASAVPGLWDVVITNPGDRSGTLPSGFEITPELEHFTFGNINDQAAGISFTVVITAYDRYDTLVVDFTDTALLSDTTGTVSPTTTSAFSSGVWTGDLTITLAQPDVTIRATSGTRFGVSNGFDVSHGPLDHLGFGTIGSPQTYDVLFSIAVTAYDTYDNVVTSYAEAADLSDRTGTLSPPVSGSFSAGAWSGDVTVSQVAIGDAITAASTISPTVIGVSNAFTVAYPAPEVLSITPNEGINTGMTAVAITGNSFFPTPSARLGVVELQSVTFVDNSNLTAVVPAGIAAGTYDLYVTNSGPLSPTGVLPDAFTVRNADIPSTTLETSFLETFGTAPSAPADGDNDSVQVVYLEVPDSYSEPLYVRIYDPDVGGGSPTDRLDVGKPLVSGPFDTATTFSLFGGVEAYTHPNARQATFITTTDPGITSGTLLWSRTFTQELMWDAEWFTIPITPTDGERVGNKQLFKLSVVGGSGDDGNGYNVSLSTSPDENIAPRGARMLAYSWTFQLERPGTVPLYPYVALTTTTFTQTNFDFDYPAQPVTITGVTPVRTFDVAALSGNGEAASSDHVVGVDESSSTWTVLCATAEVDPINDVTFWATDQNGRPLAIFTRSTIEPPP